MLKWINLCVAIITAAAMTYVLIDSIRTFWRCCKHWKESQED